jgi:hypothetical protein
MASHKDDLTRIGKVVERERINRGWNKEDAARRAGISSITWKRVEDGQRVQDTKRRAIEEVFGWDYGSLTAAAKGQPPILASDANRAGEPATDGRASDNQLVAWLGVIARFAHGCVTRGADQGAANTLIHDASELLDSVTAASPRIAVSANGAEYDADAALRRLEAERAKRTMSERTLQQLQAQVEDDVRTGQLRPPARDEHDEVFDDTIGQPSRSTESC